MSKRSEKKKAAKAAEEAAARAVSTEQAPISKDDLESKFRQIKTEVDTVTTGAVDKAVPIAAAGGILLVLLFFLVGKRVGKKKSAVVQIRRI